MRIYLTHGTAKMTQELDQKERKTLLSFNRHREIVAQKRYVIFITQEFFNDHVISKFKKLSD